ncbi:FAD-dependent monooxygenase, partial [Streptomyces sp. NRRL S-146]
MRDIAAPVIVIGAGPHGLATAALLRRSGVPAVVL